MRVKKDEQKQKRRQQAPSTGRGAASALDALIKQRIAPPDQNTSPPIRPKKH